MNYDKLKEVIASKNISIQKAANSIGKTEGWFHNSVKNDTMKVTDLENILSLCKMTLAEFFGVLPSRSLAEESPTTDTKWLSEKIELLEENRQLRLRIEKLERKEGEVEKDKPKFFR